MTSPASPSGVEYSDLRTKWMGRMSWFFHHAERLNREVTFLAASPDGPGEGLEEHAAIDKASDLTWRIHFDYQNTRKPRAMQGNSAKALLTFKNYSANMIWRLVRDTHQALHGRARRSAARPCTSWAGSPPAWRCMPAFVEPGCTASP